METKSLERRGMLRLLCCTLMWSISGLMIKQIPWNAAVIAGFRSLLAGLVMAVFIPVSGLRYRLSRTALLSAVLMSGMFLAFTLANKLTDAANAIVIQSSAPAFVLLYNVVFRKQRARPLDIFTVAATLIGISIFFFDQLTPGRLLGNAVALLAGIFLAASYIVTCGAPKEACMNGILLAHGITALIGIPMAFVFPTAFTAGAVGCIALLGIVQLGIPYVLYAICRAALPAAGRFPHRHDGGNFQSAVGVFVHRRVPQPAFAGGRAARAAVHRVVGHEIPAFRPAGCGVSKGHTLIISKEESS